MCKLLEKIVNRRLRWYLEVKKLLNPIQYGFRYYHSVIDVLTNLETNICDAFLNEEYIAAVCLDIEKAFDTISRTKIINSLIELKGNMLSFITNFLSNRSIQVRANGSLSHPIIIKNEVPQGSVMSIILFLIGIDDIITNRNQPPIKTQLFADDITITCGQNISFINEHLQTANTTFTNINTLQNWSKTTGLKFFPPKTPKKPKAFTRETKLNPPPKLYLSNLEIKFTDTIKILDLIFDKKLSWAP